jgi:hypothetical protein
VIQGYQSYHQKLPVEIVRLTSLQNLLTAKYDEGPTKLPDGIGNMRNLHTLSGFNISKSSVTAVEDLSKLTILKQRHLQLNVQGYVRNKRHEEVLMSSLCKLGNCKLQSLRIHSSDSGSMEFLDSLVPFATFPQKIPDVC